MSTFKTAPNELDAQIAKLNEQIKSVEEMLNTASDKDYISSLNFLLGGLLAHLGGLVQLKVALIKLPQPQFQESVPLPPQIVVSEEFPLPKPIDTPSSVTASVVEDKWIKGSMAADFSLMQAAYEMYRSDSPELHFTELSLKILTLAYPLTDEFTLRRPLSKTNCTAVFSSLLQEYMPASKVNNKEVLWMHQYNHMDCVGFRTINYEGRTLYEPIVFFEFAKAGSNDAENKPFQLLSHVNNTWAYECYPASEWMLCLGIVVILPNRSQEMGTFSLKGYYSVYEGNTPKLGVATIYDGSWNVENITKLLRTIYLFSERNRTKPGTIQKKWLTRNVYFTSDKVYKVFDNRYKLQVYRKDDYYFQFMPKCEYYLLSTNQNVPKLTIISYPYIHGDHYPMNSLQIVAILTKLHDYHSKNLVFADIRASNILFIHNQDDACFIDFDYMGEEGIDIYPPGFNHNINDGERHKEAIGGSFLLRIHDCYSMAKLLERFTLLEDEKDRKDWNSCIDLISKGEILNAINFLKGRDEISFMTVDELKSPHTGTNVRISPKKKL